MALFNWNSSYSVKVETFDQHHKKLIELINRLHESMGSGSGRETLLNVLDELFEYANYHFKEEEEMMEKYKYNLKVEHLSEHRFFVEKVKEIKEDYLNDGKFVTIDAYKFLKDWLISHILSADKKYSYFFNSQGVK